MKPHPAWSAPTHSRLPLVFALGLALLIHAVLLTIMMTIMMHQAATPPRPHARDLPVLRIDLIPRKTEPPKQPEWIAERNQLSEEPAPTAPELGLAPVPPVAAQSGWAETNPPPIPSAPAQPNHAEPKPPLTPASRPDRPPKAKPTPIMPAPKAVPNVKPESRTRLTDLALQSARLQADIHDPALKRAAEPRAATLTANTQEADEAAYLRAWVEKVERIGNINYPSEIRRRGLQGRLILAVTLDPSGKVTNIRVSSSSGQPLIDRAAEDIVRLAAPFAPFPPGMRERYDQITIVRTWAFLPKHELNTR